MRTIILNNDANARAAIIELLAYMAFSEGGPGPRGAGERVEIAAVGIQVSIAFSPCMEERVSAIVRRHDAR
jgi:hypothetical protein